MKVLTCVLVGIILISGAFVRIDQYRKNMISQDGLLELKHLQNKKLSSVLRNDNFYGDHTSFPGEFILHYVPIKLLGWFDNRIHIDVGGRKITGIEKHDITFLAIPKIILSIAGITLFVLMAKNLSHGVIVALLMYSFNAHLIYHFLDVRPYAVLPEFAIISLYLASKPRKKLTALHAVFIVFVSLYHAYGPLIAILPILCQKFVDKDTKIPYIPIIIGLLGWAYYASYSTFGMVPNETQTIVSPFESMPRANLVYVIVATLFGNQLLMMCVLPFVFVKLSDRKFFGEFVILVVLPILLICLVDIKTNYRIHGRQFVWVMPWFALLCGRAMDTFQPPARPQ